MMDTKQKEEIFAMLRQAEEDFGLWSFVRELAGLNKPTENDDETPIH